jgi:Ferritin-like
MLKIGLEHVTQIRAARSPEDLHGLVQKAIELEHATIPAYLCAVYTVKPGSNHAAEP